MDTTATGAASLVYSTFLGGSQSTAGFDIALGSNHVAYVTGFTLASDFPVSPGAYLTSASNVRNWTSTAIAVTVPRLATGSLGVTVEAASVKTNSRIFTVNSPGD